MNELDTRDRRGAHRMQRGPLQAVLPGLLALAAVGALVVAVLVMRGTAPSTTVAATSGPTASTAASATGSPATDAATPAGTASPSASTGPGDAATDAPTDGASPTPGDTSSAGTDTGAMKSSTSVVVLNQTRISGLAGQVAQTLRGAGWTVSGTGNFSGNVPATTVYYPEGMQAAAEALAADVPGPDRVRPRFGNLSKDKLTVIVTSAAG
ncbi:MAG TPA: LytR C-terminal domain-containing protein [Motilibacteraceae bacterium]|nr:LytR C-terminal domain-containing protein [Motilibacteraceae bacterium]